MSEPRYKIEREKSLPLFGNWRLDWETKWLFALACGLGALAFVSSVFKIYGILMPAILFAGIFYIVFIFIPMPGLDDKKLLSWLFRRARHDMGEQMHRSDRVERGENLFGSDRRPQPKKFSKHLGRVEFIPFEVAPGQYIGVAHDRRERTYTVGMSVGFGSLMLDSSAVRHGRITGFGNFLNRVATGRFHRFAWRVQILPGESIDLEGDVQSLQESHGLTSHPGHDPSAFIQQYEEAVGRQGNERLITFFFTMSNEGHLRRRARKLPGGMSELLIREVDNLVSDLGLALTPNSIGLKSIGFLGYNEMLAETRMVLDPVFMVPVRRESDLLNGRGLFRESLAWPQACAFKYADHAIVGETVHSGFFIDEFTREGVSAPDFDWLLNANFPMTVTGVYAFVPWNKAFGRAVKTTNATGGVVKELLAEGKEPTQSQLMEVEEAMAREKELSELMATEVLERYYVDITGRTPEEVRSVAEDVRSLAVRNGMPISGLTLRQEDGISVLLPVGRGLRTSSAQNWLSSVRR